MLNWSKLIIQQLNSAGTDFVRIFKFNILIQARQNKVYILKWNFLPKQEYCNVKYA